MRFKRVRYSYHQGEDGWRGAKTHIDNVGYGRTMDAIGGLVACAHDLAPIEDGKAMRRVLRRALAFGFGKPAITIVGMGLVALAVYLVRLALV